MNLSVPLPKGNAMPLFQFLEPTIDREFVDTVIAFANLESLEDHSGDYVVPSEGMKKVLRFFQEHDMGLSGDDAYTPPGKPITVEMLYAEHRAEQKRLIAVLDKIIDSGEVDDSVRRQLAAGVQALDLVGNACFRRGRFEVFVKPTHLSLRQWYSVVVALLVENGLDKRLGRCKECQKFFMSWPGKRGKRPQIFCSRPCLDANKQRAYRNRKKRKHR